MVLATVSGALLMGYFGQRCCFALLCCAVLSSFGLCCAGNTVHWKYTGNTPTTLLYCALQACRLEFMCQASWLPARFKSQPVD